MGDALFQLPFGESSALNGAKSPGAVMRAKDSDDDMALPTSGSFRASSALSLVPLTVI